MGSWFISVVNKHNALESDSLVNLSLAV